MNEYAAFLRAINVGGRTVKMERLRQLFSDTGFTDVRTVIASGNVLFTSNSDDASALEDRIETELARKLGFSVDTMVRTPAELRRLVDSSPFATAETEPDNVVYLAFTRAPLSDAEQRTVMALSTDAHEFRVEGPDIYWLRHRKLDDGRFSGAALEKAIGRPATARNMNTVRRIADIFG